MTDAIPDDVLVRPDLDDLERRIRAERDAAQKTVDECNRYVGDARKIGGGIVAVRSLLRFGNDALALLAYARTAAARIEELEKERDRYQEREGTMER